MAELTAGAVATLCNVSLMYVVLRQSNANSETEIEQTTFQGKLLVECLKEPSVLSFAQCIASDFLLRSKTNFYIPKESLSGYSYLNEEITPHSPHHGHTNLFVSAEPTTELHAHQWHHPTYFPSFSNHSKHLFPLHHTSDVSNAQVLHPTITIPYIHPEMQLPVPPLELPVYFGVLCFSFTLGGIIMLRWVPQWVMRGHWFPYRAFAWALILFQGPCSFLADYVHMTNNSHWHLIDRFLACLLMSCEMVKLVTMSPYTRPLVYALHIIAVSIAIICFVNSQQSQKDLDTDGFIFWHCGWHCYPITGTMVVGLDRWLVQQYGEYYSFEDNENKNRECEYKRGEGGGKLLSTLVMEYIYGEPSCKI